MHANIVDDSRLSLSQNNSDIFLSISDWEFEAAAKSLNFNSDSSEDGISAGFFFA